MRHNPTLHTPGNGIIDETEFLQWVARIQALREDPNTKSSALATDEDDITQDLIAAFRYVGAEEKRLRH